ncbi:MAG: Signal transduction response regulator [Candidatus Lokiarchaeum sp. GC14_75]|nr:MAG: Signal transduction response regulator [Candidatus Lokiarchaeum sp. GC14_75]
MSKVILVVDDEPDILNLTQKFLKIGNFDTITSSNAKEAMIEVESRYNEIALILLDIMMPGRSGMDVLRQIKEDNRFKHILVVLFTVKSFAEDIQKGKRLGADGYITKPFSGKELLKYVQNLLH